ncbi:hypothetical protein GFY24_33985 [Nocardia sp. SYP-A9097]|uniref:hypothetical protein n=1 Tax=Nocardia sp. SYP-A9097 TaxID=2663237 RepID=UPI00129AD14E|nr:hypothetical protein [Nocardia sp. SYP-A9097]MRH92377.1 hypothetical protein [Nocardia sp. SYP-A9097]
MALPRQWAGQGIAAHVHGPPGVGKSALLRRFAADRAGAGHDVIFLQGAGLAVADLTQELFQSCYDAPGYLPDPVRLRRLMGSIRALIVVDDFEGSAEELTALSDAVPSSELIVSTARRIAWTGGHSLELLGLDEQSALALITRELGRDLGADEAVARQLCRAARGYPRALVQAAAWLRNGGPANAVVDPAVLQRTMVAGLGGRPRHVLAVMYALAGVPLSIAVCQAMTRDAAIGGALGELVGLGLADRSEADYRLAVDPSVVAAGLPGTTPDAADYVETLLEWVSRTAAPSDIVAAAAVLVRVLDAAVMHSRSAPACALARKVSPVFAITLRWSAWRSVLKLGEHAAIAIGSAGDRAYFEHEDRIRRRALTAVAGVAIGGVGVGGGLAVGIAGAAIATNDPTPAGSQALLTTTFAQQPTAGIITTVDLTTPSTTDKPVTPTAAPRQEPSDTGGFCPPVGDSADFGTVAVGETVVREVSFTQLACDNVTASSVQGDSVFTAVRTSCPPNTNGQCVFRVTFRPKAPGSYQAALFVPDTYGNQQDVAITLTGSATATSSTTVPLASGQSLSNPATSNHSTAAGSPTAPQPPTTTSSTAATAPTTS